MKGRVKRIFSNLDKDVDAIVIFNGAEPHLDNTFFYATGLVNGLFEGSAAIMRKDGSLHVITSKLEEESASHAKEANVTAYATGVDRDRLLKKALARYGRVGFNSDEITYKGYMTIKKATNGRLIDVADAVGQARMHKDNEELAHIRKACKIASRTADAIPGMLRNGMREYELAAEINHMMQTLGATGPSFTTISSFGPNTAEPHYSAGEAKLRKGVFVLCDFGAWYRKYASDITRTYVFGRASREQKGMYEVIQEAQAIGVDAIRDSSDGKDVDRQVRDHIDSTKYKGLFIHSTGHSIGLSVHDGGRLSVNASQPLEEGMVFTIEPGIYVPGYGGVRIEDDVLLKKKGIEVLTTADKDLIEV